MKKFLYILFLTLFFLPGYSFAEEKLIVLLDWFINPNHAPLFVALDQGFFKQQGLDVELIGPADPSDPPKLVAAGKADIAITYQPQFMQQVDRGLPLIRIGTLIDKPLNALVVLKENNIKSIKDLKNKSIGSSTGEMNGLALKTMLASQGISLSEVKRINVHYDLTQALLSKKVDAVTGMMRNFELIQLDLAGKPGQAFYPEQYGVPTYSELILVVNIKNLNQPKFKRFLIALKQGQDFLQKHPEAMWKKFSSQHRELRNELNKRAWLVTLPLFNPQPAQFDPNQWQQFASFMLKNGLIKKMKPIHEYTIDLLKE